MRPIFGKQQSKVEIGHYLQNITFTFAGVQKQFKEVLYKKGINCWVITNCHRNTLSKRGIVWNGKIDN